jgi:hypothetical protein
MKRGYKINSFPLYPRICISMCTGVRIFVSFYNRITHKWHKNLLDQLFLALPELKMFSHTHTQIILSLFARVFLPLLVRVVVVAFAMGRVAVRSANRALYINYLYFNFFLFMTCTNSFSVSFAPAFLPTINVYPPWF